MQVCPLCPPDDFPPKRDSSWWCAIAPTQWIRPLPAKPWPGAHALCRLVKGPPRSVGAADRAGDGRGVPLLVPEPAEGAGFLLCWAGVGCVCLVAQLCLTLCDPMDVAHQE